MAHTKLVSVTVAAFLMTLIWTLPTAYAVHCKGQHADDPSCPPPPADVHDDLKADHADLATDHDGLGLASEHTGLATGNDELATDHDGLATDHDGLALAAPANELVTLINNQTIEPGESIEPTAIDVSDAKFISFLTIISGFENLMFQHVFLSSTGTFSDVIPKNRPDFTCTLTSSGPILVGNGSCSSQVYGPFLAIKVSSSINNNTQAVNVTVQAWLQK